MHFNYIYGIGVLGCLAMYGLLGLMSMVRRNEINNQKCQSDVQSGASYLSQGFVMFFHVSCEGLPGQ